MANLMVILNTVVAPALWLINKIVSIFSKTTAEKVESDRNRIVKEREELEKNPNRRPPSNPF